MTKVKRNKWYVCRNKNGVYYKTKNKALSLHEFWDKRGFAQIAVFGPCDKLMAIEYVNDMNTPDLDYGKPNDIIAFNSNDDFDDDDYAGLVSNLNE